MGPMGQLVHMQCHLWNRKNYEMEALHKRTLFLRRKKSSIENLHFCSMLEYFALHNIALRNSFCLNNGNYSKV